MAYMQKELGTTFARAAGIWNEDGALTEGEVGYEGQADLQFNEVVLSLGEHLSSLTREVVNQVTAEVLFWHKWTGGKINRSTIARKFASRSASNYERCKPCPSSIAPLSNLQMPPTRWP